VARDLSDVLHYFIDEPRAEEPEARRPPGTSQAVRLTILLDPGEDLRRAMVERLARAVFLGGEEAASRVVTPAEFTDPFVPPRLPEGVRRIAVASDGPAELDRASQSVADAGPGWVLTLVPDAWLPSLGEAPQLFANSLLFTSPDEADLDGARRQTDALRRAVPDGRIGATIHDVVDLSSAEATFLELARRVEAEGLERLHSYGAVLDDRAILSGALGQPSAGADEALRPVADLLRHDLVGAAA